MSNNKEYAIRLFRSKMAFYDDKIEALAADLGITRPTCSKKINTVEGWTNDEIAKIAARYGLTDDEIIKMFDLNRYCNNEYVDCGGKKQIECIVSDTDPIQLNIKVTNQIDHLKQLGANIIKTALNGNEYTITYEI